jgi:hypothetical protein
VPSAGVKLLKLPDFVPLLREYGRMKVSKSRWESVALERTAKADVCPADEEKNHDDA